ncbi:Pc06g00590, partial [Penicillium rubens Wisconsin 54-1255]
ERYFHVTAPLYISVGINNFCYYRTDCTLLCGDDSHGAIFLLRLCCRSRL